MPRPKGSLNKKKKQSVEERKANRKASKKANSVQSRQAEYAKRKLDRKEKKILELTLRIKKQLNELYGVGRFSGCNDPAFKELSKLLESPIEKKIEYVSTNISITLDPDTDPSHVNRMTMMVFHCKLEHKGRGLRMKTLSKFIQSELQKSAMAAENVTQDTLRNFF